ncbi:hypothetical protein T10_974, partial [Trichinella papuae]
LCFIDLITTMVGNWRSRHIGIGCKQRWRALLQHKMWEKWMYILGPLLRNTIGDLISPLTGGNGGGMFGGNVGMPFGNSGRLLGGGNNYGPNSGGILENLGSRFLGGGGLMNGMEERPLVGILNNLLGGRNQGLLGRNNFRNRNGFDRPKGYDYYD